MYYIIRTSRSRGRRGWELHAYYQDGSYFFFFYFQGIIVLYTYNTRVSNALFFMHAQPAPYFQVLRPTESRDKQTLATHYSTCPPSLGQTFIYLFLLWKKGPGFYFNVLSFSLIIWRQLSINIQVSSYLLILCKVQYGHLVKYMFNIKSNTHQCRYRATYPLWHLTSLVGGDGDSSILSHLWCQRRHTVLCFNLKCVVSVG